METVAAAAAYIRSTVKLEPHIALVLGSGLGSLADECRDAVALPYSDIPHFPLSGAPGHAGRLVAGRLNGAPVFIMQGRFHYYEGHPLASIAFPIRVFKALGVSTLFLTNAAGGVNTDFAPGDCMIIRDHINLTGQNPLIGSNDEAVGPRFPDMSTAYTPRLIAIARRAAERLGIRMHEGVYAWFTGPSFETPAEIRMARILGADAVGMSTVPEVILARHAGMETLALSCVTNMAAGILPQPITSDEVLEIAAKRRPQLSALVQTILAEL